MKVENHEYYLVLCIWFCWKPLTLASLSGFPFHLFIHLFIDRFSFLEQRWPLLLKNCFRKEPEIRGNWGRLSHKITLFQHNPLSVSQNLFISFFLYCFDVGGMSMDTKKKCALVSVKTLFLQNRANMGPKLALLFLFF